MQYLEKYDMDFLKPQGAFYVFIDISKTGMTARDFAVDLLHQQKVVVAPCGTFGASGTSFIRICFAGNVEELKQGLQRMGRFYQERMNKGKADC